MKQLSILCFNKTHFVHELRARGHRVCVAALEDTLSEDRLDSWSLLEADLTYSKGESLSSILKRLPQDFVPNRLVYYEDSSPIFHIREIEHCPFPSLFYSVDAHIHHLWHPEMSGVFDCVLVAQKNFVARFQECADKASWFPLWAPHIPNLGHTRNIDVCFRGSLNRPARAKRADFIEALNKKIQIDSTSGPYLEAFPRSKIVINEAIADDVNFRVFEIMACGALLLNQKVGNGLLDLFENNTHLVTYNPYDVEDAYTKIKHLLSHPEELSRIANCGLQEVLKKHTAQVRAEELEQHLLSLNVSPRMFANYSACYRELFELAGWRPSDPQVFYNRVKVTCNLFLRYSAQQLPSNINIPYMLLYLARMLDILKLQEELRVLALSSFRAWSSEGAIALICYDILKKLGQTNEADQIATSIGVSPIELGAISNDLIAKLQQDSFFENLQS